MCFHKYKFDRFERLEIVWKSINNTYYVHIKLRTFVLSSLLFLLHYYYCYFDNDVLVFTVEPCYIEVISNFHIQTKTRDLLNGVSHQVGLPVVIRLIRHCPKVQSLFSLFINSLVKQRISLLICSRVLRIILTASIQR